MLHMFQLIMLWLVQKHYTCIVKLLCNMCLKITELSRADPGGGGASRGVLTSSWLKISSIPPPPIPLKSMYRVVLWHHQKWRNVQERRVQIDIREKSICFIVAQKKCSRGAIPLCASGLTEYVVIFWHAFILNPLSLYHIIYQLRGASYINNYLTKSRCLMWI